jgi:hypothetical protein
LRARGRCAWPSPAALGLKGSDAPELTIRASRRPSDASAPGRPPRSQAAQTFLDNYRCFGAFVATVATLDVLAGFAVATHPAAAPPGCTFCRPVFESHQVTPGCVARWDSIARDRHLGRRPKPAPAPSGASELA